MAEPIASGGGGVGEWQRGASDHEPRDVFVGDLAASTCEHDVRRVFGAFGRVESVHIKRRDRPAPAAYAFVRMGAHDMAARAIGQLDRSALGAATIRVRWARQNLTLAIDGVGPRATSRLVDGLMRSFGAVVPGFTFVVHERCWVQFRDRRDAETARDTLAGRVLFGAPVPCRIEWCTVARHVVHVQFAKGVDGADLRRTFSTFGPVRQVDLPAFPNGRLKGFGFVHFRSDPRGVESAQMAVRALDWTIVRGGTVVRCHVAQQVARRSGSGPDGRVLGGESPAVSPAIVYGEAGEAHACEGAACGAVKAAASPPDDADRHVSG